MYACMNVLMNSTNFLFLTLFNILSTFQYPKCTLSEDYGKFLLNKQFCDIVFIVGHDEIKIAAHIAIVAARSQYLKSKILVAKDSRKEHFEKLFGTTDVQLTTEMPQLEVKMPNMQPDAFEMVLFYIYTGKHPAVSYKKMQ